MDPNAEDQMKDTAPAAASTATGETVSPAVTSAPTPTAPASLADQISDLQAQIKGQKDPGKVIKLQRQLHALQVQAQKECLAQKKK